MFSLVLLSLAASAVASPQAYGAPPSGPATTSSSAAAAPSAPASTSGFVNVDVAAGGSFVFNPANVTASNGTVVTFFFPSSGIQHSVTQSSFSAPCTPLDGGFNSGLTDSKQFSITVLDDTQPIWFHCQQVTHCGLGMVGSINAQASGNQTFSSFQNAAKAIGGSEATETNTAFISGGVNAIASQAPAATASASAGSSGSSTTSGAGRVGVGAAVVVGASAAIMFLTNMA